MRRADSGRGYPSLIFAVAVLSAIAYVGIKTVPVFVHNYELQDHLRQVAIRATVERTSTEAVQNSIIDFARDLDLPVTRESVKITHSGTRIIIDLDYRVPIDLKVYTLELHFTPSAENRRL